MYREWCQHKHSLGLEYIPCDLEDKIMIAAATLKFGLVCFIMEVKKVNREEFPGIQFHLECLSFAFKLINDIAFKDLKFILDNTMKAHTSQMIGISVQKAEVFSATDKDILWSLGFLGPDNPEQLLNTEWSY